MTNRSPDDPVRGFAETFTIKEGTACDLELLTLTMNKAVNAPKSPPKSPSKMQAIRKASEALAGEGENDGVKPKKVRVCEGQSYELDEHVFEVSSLSVETSFDSTLTP